MLNHFCKQPLWECTRTLAAVPAGRGGGGGPRGVVG